jgi:hypothetical protein
MFGLVEAPFDSVSGFVKGGIMGDSDFPHALGRDDGSQYHSGFYPHSSGAHHRPSFSMQLCATMSARRLRKRKPEYLRADVWPGNSGSLTRELRRKDLKFRHAFYEESNDGLPRCSRVVHFRYEEIKNEA